MANCGENTNKSQFYICFVATPYLNKKSQVIGSMVSGFDILKTIEKCGSEDGTPTRRVTVSDSGLFSEEFEASKVEAKRIAEEKAPKLFDDQMAGYPSAFEWFVVDLRHARKDRYEQQKLAKQDYVRREKDAKGETYDVEEMQAKRLDTFLQKYRENWIAENKVKLELGDIVVDEKQIRKEGKREFSKNPEDAENEESLYSEAEFKWLRLSEREKMYYMRKAQELPIANQRVLNVTRHNPFNPQPFQAFMDLERDTRFM